MGPCAEAFSYFSRQSADSIDRASPWIRFEKKKTSRRKRPPFFFFRIEKRSRRVGSEEKQGRRHPSVFVRVRSLSPRPSSTSSLILFFSSCPFLILQRGEKRRSRPLRRKRAAAAAFFPRLSRWLAPRRRLALFLSSLSLSLSFPFFASLLPSFRLSSCSSLL